MMKNSRFLACSCLAALSGILANNVFASDREIKIALSWVPSMDDAGLWIAQDRGYFSKEGLVVSCVPGGPNAPNALVSLSAGSVHVAITDWLSLVDASEKGNDFVAIAAVFPITPAALISLPTKPIRRPADILDKRILVESPNHRIIFDAILLVNGLPVRYEPRQSGYSADPLFAGDGDGYLGFVTNQPLALAAAGKLPGRDFVVTSLRDLGFDVPEDLIVVRRDFILHNRSVVVAFLRALSHGWEDNAKDSNIAAKLVVDRFGDDYGLELAVERKKNEIQIPLTKSPTNGRFLWISPSQITFMYKVAAISALSRQPPKSDLFDLTLLEEAVPPERH